MLLGILFVTAILLQIAMLQHSHPRIVSPRAMDNHTHTTLLPTITTTICNSETRAVMPLRQELGRTRQSPATTPIEHALDNESVIHDMHPIIGKASSVIPLLLSSTASSTTIANSSAPNTTTAFAPDTTLKSSFQEQQQYYHLQQVGSCLNLVEQCQGYLNETRPQSRQRRLAYGVEPTLALAEPVLKGGYRNQYMRFVGLVIEALSNGQSILLESIKWHEKASRYGIPFELLFDVDIWNANPNLPKFVRYSERRHPQWNRNTTLFRGTCSLVLDWLEHNPHGTFFFTRQREKQKRIMNAPYAAGGVREGVPGNLWDTYQFHNHISSLSTAATAIADTINTNHTNITSGRRIQVRTRPHHNPDPASPGDESGTTFAISLSELEEWILTSMRPSRAVQELVNSLMPSTPFITLHPRVEPDMLRHPHCQAHKMRSLKVVLDQVIEYPEFKRFQQLFLPVAMPQMTLVDAHDTSTSSNATLWYNNIHEENIEILHTLFTNGTRRSDGSHVHVWNAGESSLQDRKINPCMITLLASIVNMELAAQSEIFVGTRVSTWSHSVWKVRYYRGLPNYEFLPTGIHRVDGLPPPFDC